MVAQSETYRLKITGLRLSVTDESALLEALAHALGVAAERIKSMRILRRSLDARQRTLSMNTALQLMCALISRNWPRCLPIQG